MVMLRLLSLPVFGRWHSLSRCANALGHFETQWEASMAAAAVLLLQQCWVWAIARGRFSVWRKQVLKLVTNPRPAPRPAPILLTSSALCSFHLHGRVFAGWRVPAAHHVQQTLAPPSCHVRLQFNCRCSTPCAAGRRVPAAHHVWRAISRQAAARALHQRDVPPQCERHCSMLAPQGSDVVV